MTSDMNFSQGVPCLVCNKNTTENPVNIYSGLARRNGSIRDQILEIVGNLDIAEACETSEVVCPQCLKLLLNINNMEFELKNLKVEFFSIFQIGVESRKMQLVKNTDYSKIGYEKYSTTESDKVDNNNEKGLSLNYSGSERDYRTCVLETDNDTGTFNSANIVADDIKDSFSINHSSLSENHSVNLEESATNGLTQNKTGDLVDISHQNDRELQKELTHALHLVSESQKKFETDFTLSDRPRVENEHGPTGPIHSDGQFTMLPNSHNVMEYDRVSDITSSNVPKNLEGNLSFDFENFETRLCSDVMAVKDESRQISSKNVKRPKRKPADSIGKKPLKRKRTPKKDKKVPVARKEDDSVRDSEMDDVWNWEDNLHEECQQDENKRKSCDLCKDKICKLCAVAFNTMDELADHRGRMHSDIYKYVCDKCPNVRYCHKAKLTNHFRLRHKIHVHQCPGCDVEETSQNSLDQHIIKKHPESRYFECKICCKAFRTYRYLHCVHIKRCHIGLPVKYFCDKCKKGFVDKSSLDNHKYTHSEVKNYACEFCGALFHTPYSLKVHVNTHTQEKKYTCPVCGMSFLRLCNLIGHKKRAHYSRDKKYVCEICGTQVHTNKDLVQHQILYHKQGKPFTCEKCGKSFANKRNLKEHLQIQHLRERPYKCHCGKAYVNKSRLRYHHRAVHMMESNRQPTVEDSLLEEGTKTVDEDNEEENMVVITVKECNPHAMYSVQTAPPHSHEVMITSEVPSSHMANNVISDTLTNTQGVELPLLHSPFGTIGTERIGLSAPILFTSLNTNPVGAVPHGQETVPEEIPQSKFEPAIAQITGGLQATVPFHPTSASRAVAEDQDPLEILPGEITDTQTTEPLTTELLGLPSMHTSTPSTVPVTYITAWPT